MKTNNEKATKLVVFVDAQKGAMKLVSIQETNKVYQKRDKLNSFIDTQKKLMSFISEYRKK